MTQSNRWAYNIAVLALLLGPCDETLPPYSEPEKILDGAMSGLYIWGIGQRLENKLTVYFTFTNIYEETLDDTVSIRGSVEIRSARLPHIKKSFSIGPANILSGLNYYNRQTRRLTLDPGNSVTFSVSWDFVVDDRNIDPRDEMFIFYVDPGCTSFCRAVREDLVLTAEVHVFDQRAPVNATTVFPICYASGAPCSTFITDPPCLEPPSPTWARCYPFIKE